ncbi:hypothetical protein OIU84_011795 [Salix udensis]|uniref:DUF4220 domain-containing protein n=1 Tax=Salix udensis TaxID=889485 RepID=A0AAD6JQT2_9ROSI|nr:hypothetical protein OIU84_011795 [Salix udensis]
MGFPKLSATVQRLWNGWELRVVMLISLILQIFLILSGRRRKYTAGFWIGKLVWLAYLSADWVATFSLGILAQKIGDSETNCINSTRKSIPAFWAPVLLVHLGGPDTITAYSMEQCRNEMNELSRKFEEFSNPDVFEMTDEPVVGEVGLSDIIPRFS